MPRNASPQESPLEPPQVYYVENVDGADYTFYLSIENNETLLVKPNVDPLPETDSEQDQKQRLHKNRLSDSTRLNVIKISPLLKRGDLIDGGSRLLEQLNLALSRSQSETESVSPSWGKLVERFSGKLQREIKNNWQEELANRNLLPTLLKELNCLLTTEDIGTLLNDPDDGLDADERLLIKNFSPAGQRAYRNRKLFNKHFQEAIRLFVPQLSPASGRAFICRSYLGKLLSVSFREKPQKSLYRPDDNPSEKYPLTIKDYCSAIYETIKEIERRGLLVITGETNSSKSEIATGLIYSYLEDQKSDSKRLPHLVTFEDPIEKFYANPGISEASNLSVRMPALLDHGIDYTPREKGTANETDKDVEVLKDALQDALRQTPTVLFVGETRDKDDWRRLIDFASTGHLIVTTAHAGSLTEAMHKIFVALRVKTPAERSEVANRLLGIVHIRSDAETKVLVPALWRRTLSGKHALTAEGLSSLLPYKPGDDQPVGCLGRAWFAEKLEVDVQKRNDDPQSGSQSGILDWKDLKKRTIAWDLEGI